MCTFIVLVLYTTIEQTNSNLTYLSNIPLIPPAHEARKVATADLFNGVRTSFVTILYFITLNKQYDNIEYYTLLPTSIYIQKFQMCFHS